jgi:ubiquinone/menaquinone biosynthesis C-methylase UbiE
MDHALQRRVQRYGWDKASRYYETFWQHQLAPAQELLLEMAQLSEGETALDVACGSGLVSFRLLDRIGNGHVVGVDISEKMIEMAASLAAQKGETRIRFQRMDAEQLVLGDQTFDVVLCALGLMYMPAPLRALEEMYRVLKPGGRVVAAVWGERRHCGWAEIFGIVDQHVSSEVCPMFFNLGNPGMLELNLKAAGFSNILTHRIQTTLHYRNAEEAIGAAFDGGPVALAYNRFNPSVKQQVHTDYLASIAPYAAEHGYAVPGEFLVASGVR